LQARSLHNNLGKIGSIVGKIAQTNTVASYLETYQHIIAQNLQCAKVTWMYMYQLYE